MRTQIAISDLLVIGLAAMIAFPGAVDTYASDRTPRPSHDQLLVERFAPCSGQS